MQYGKIDAPKKDQKKSNFVSSDSVLLLVCYLGRVFLHRNARNICVAICGRFAKNIANFTGLNFGYTLKQSYKEAIFQTHFLFLSQVQNCTIFCQKTCLSSK